MRPKFKSFTDINNYNNFLLDLDKKHNKIEKVEKNINASVSDVIKEIDKTYHSFEYNSNNFTGENRLDKLLDVLRNVDPNLYDVENNCNQTTCNTTCNVKTSKKSVILKIHNALIVIIILNVLRLPSLIILSAFSRHTSHFKPSLIYSACLPKLSFDV